MDRDNLLKRDALKAVTLFAAAVGIEIALCVAVVLFALPINLVRFAVWVLWFAIAFLAWARYLLWGRSSPASAPSSPREYLIYLFLAASYGGVVFWIPHSCFQTFRVPSGAMEPTILIGDRILVRKCHVQVQRGDIVTFVSPPAAILTLDRSEAHKVFLKRVVGMPGDLIMIHDKQVLLNGQSLPEPYITHSDTMSYSTSVLAITQNYQDRWESGAFAHLTRREIGDSFGPVRVPENTFFLLGDNRAASFDSRFWGPLPKELVTGKAIRIYSPPSHAKEL
jgi:signal peptidase I